MLRLWLLVTLVAACGAAPRPAAPLPPATPRPPAPGEATAIRAIEPGVLRGLMTAGELTIAPDETTAAELARDPRPVLVARVKVCLDTTGAAIGHLVNGSKVAAFDQAALAAVAGWRFRPYLDDGVARPACSDAAFAYVRPRDGGPATSEPALPAPRIELPAAVEQPAAWPVGATRVPPTPGVAMAGVCRRPGTRTAPTITWLQSSGDVAVDRALFERRATAPVDEPLEDAVDCTLAVAFAGPAPRAAAPPASPSPPPPPPPPPPARNIVPIALEQQRISGDRDIFPSDLVKTAIARRGIQVLMVAVKICIDTAGRPMTVNIMRSSGFLAYDADMINAIATWRYRPLTIDGRPVPVCSAIQFIYRQKPPRPAGRGW